MDLPHTLFAHLTAVTLAYIIDTVLGDPRTPLHPVVRMGVMISFLEKRFNRGGFRRIKGFFTTIVPGIFITAVAYFVVKVSYTHIGLAAVLIEALLLWLFIGGQSMISHIHSIYQKLQTDNIDEARQQTAMIVSRDTDKLHEKDIIKASLESIGENISDSVTAPLIFALIGGAPLAAFYRFINTSDAMIGYRTQRFKDYGFAAAKLDDILNYIPSRLTAILMTTAVWKIRKSSWMEAISVTLKYSRFHESPNAGYGEAAMAGILHIMLGGPTIYHGKVRKRPFLGCGERMIDISCLRDGIYVWRITILSFIILIWLLGGLGYVIYGI